MLFGAVESGAELCVRGTGIGLENRLRYEGGADNWVVKCECGAQDDDGERMVECDVRSGSTLAAVALRTVRLFLHSLCAQDAAPHSCHQKPPLLVVSSVLPGPTN